MDNRMILQQSLDYIEENLQTEITAAELADMAGFSLFHYYRLFQQSTGMPVMQYILRRRLLHGVYAISKGSTRIHKEKHMTVTHKKAAQILQAWNLEGATIADIYYEGTGNFLHIKSHSWEKFAFCKLQKACRSVKLYVPSA